MVFQIWGQAEPYSICIIYYIYIYYYYMSTTSISGGLVYDLILDVFGMSQTIIYTEIYMYLHLKNQPINIMIHFTVNFQIIKIF